MRKAISNNKIPADDHYHPLRSQRRLYRARTLVALAVCSASRIARLSVLYSSEAGQIQHPLHGHEMLHYQYLRIKKTVVCMGARRVMTRKLSSSCKAMSVPVSVGIWIALLDCCLLARETGAEESGIKRSEGLTSLE